MLREIQDLLQEVARQQQQQGGQQQRPQPQGVPGHQTPYQQPYGDEIEILDDEPLVIEAEVVESPSEHAAHYLDTRDISEHASHLGDRVRNSEAEMEARLQKKFGHDGDDLQHKQPAGELPGAQAEADSINFVAEVVGMLQNPHSISQAVLMSEIMQRPSDRW